MMPLPTDRSLNLCSSFGKLPSPPEAGDTFPVVQQDSGCTQLYMATLFIETTNGKRAVVCQH